MSNFVTVKNMTPARVKAAAADLDAFLGKCANGEAKPKDIPMEALAVVIQHARDTHSVTPPKYPFLIVPLENVEDGPFGAKTEVDAREIAEQGGDLMIVIDTVRGMWLQAEPNEDHEITPPGPTPTSPESTS